MEMKDLVPHMKSPMTGKGIENPHGQEGKDDRFPPVLDSQERKKVVDFLMQRGALVDENQQLVNPSFLSHLKSKGTDYFFRVNMSHLASFLLEKQVEIADPSDENSTIKVPVFNFPSNLEELMHSKSIGAVDFANFAFKNNNIAEKEIRLSDGTITTFKEISFLRAFNALSPIRNSEGELLVIDPDTQQRVPFNFKMIRHTLKGPALSILSHMSAEQILQKYLPNMKRLGTLTVADVLSRGNTATGERYGTKERFFRGNGKPHYFSFYNDGVTLYYYLGRKKIVGTNIDIDPETMRLIQLDRTTVGVVRKDGHDSSVVATFTLFDSRRANEFRKVVEEKLVKNSDKTNIRPSTVSQYSHVPESIMSELIQEYDVDSLLPEYIQTNPRYDQIKNHASNPDYVTKDFRDLARKTGVPVMDLTWKEQVVTATIVKDLFKEEEIVPFLQKYKSDGLKTFLSVLHGGKEMGDKILTLGDETKFPRPLAEKLFSKYGSFVDSANNIQEEIAYLVGDNRALDTSKISEKLLVRAKNLLVEYANAAKVGVIDEKNIDEDLEHIHKEIAILGYAYIEMARQSDYADLEDLGKVEVTVRATIEYTAAEKDELEKVYIYSRPKETFDNKEHVELLKKEFHETLEREDVTVFDVALDNKKIAFALLYYKDPKTLHMGGLSFHPDARNPAVGLAVMESMAKNLGAYAIEAEVHSENKVLAMYTNRFGFKIVGEEPREKNAGELYYIIRKEPAKEDQHSST